MLEAGSEDAGAGHQEPRGELVGLVFGFAAALAGAVEHDVAEFVCCVEAAVLRGFGGVEEYVGTGVAPEREGVDVTALLVE